jgi:hypothetical protein
VVEITSILRTDTSKDLLKVLMKLSTHLRLYENSMAAIASLCVRFLVGRCFRPTGLSGEALNERDFARLACSKRAQRGTAL